MDATGGSYPAKPAIQGLGEASKFHSQYGLLCVLRWKRSSRALGNSFGTKFDLESSTARVEHAQPSRSSGSSKCCTSLAAAIASDTEVACLGRCRMQTKSLKEVDGNRYR